MINIFEHYQLGEKLYEQVVSGVYKKHNLTYMEFTVMMFLANNKYDTASDIVKYRSLTKSHISLAVKTLEEKGIIACKYQKNDRRTKHLQLTDLAKNIVEDGRVAQKQFIEMLNCGLSDSDIEKIKDIFEIINENIKNNLADFRRDNNAK